MREDWLAMMTRSTSVFVSDRHAVVAELHKIKLQIDDLSRKLSRGAARAGNDTNKCDSGTTEATPCWNDCASEFVELRKHVRDDAEAAEEDIEALTHRIETTTDVVEGAKEEALVALFEEKQNVLRLKASIRHAANVKLKLDRVVEASSMVKQRLRANERKRQRQQELIGELQAIHADVAFAAAIGYTSSTGDFLLRPRNDVSPLASRRAFTRQEQREQSSANSLPDAPANAARHTNRRGREVLRSNTLEAGHRGGTKCVRRARHAFERHFGGAGGTMSNDAVRIGDTVDGCQRLSPSNEGDRVLAATQAVVDEASAQYGSRRRCHDARRDHVVMHRTADSDLCKNKRRGDSSRGNRRNMKNNTIVRTGIPQSTHFTAPEQMKRPTMKQRMGKRFTDGLAKRSTWRHATPTRVSSVPSSVPHSTRFLAQTAASAGRRREPHHHDVKCARTMSSAVLHTGFTE